MKAELKLRSLTDEEIAKAVGGELHRFGKEMQTVTNVTYDSRDVTPGSLFCAIKGERVDGHDYIKDTVKNGCRVALVERIPGDNGALHAHDGTDSRLLCAAEGKIQQPGHGEKQRDQEDVHAQSLTFFHHFT